MLELDENFRRRVARLAERDESRLGDEARERIVRRTVEEVPRLAARNRRLRALTAASVPALAAAAVAMLVLGHRAGKETAPTAAAANPPVCATRHVSESAGFVRGEVGQTLDLGATAFARASADADVRLVEASPCKTLLELSSGSVTIHAKDLGGGELAVRTRDGEVRVHGTLFAVTDAGDGLAVEVVEGLVQVSHKSAAIAVAGGERVLASQIGVARGSLSRDRARELRVAVMAAEVVGFDALKEVDAVKEEPRKPSASAVPSRSKVEAETVELASTPEADPLSQAELARRTHDYARARELYRQAAQAGGTTGEAAWVALARMELGLGRAQAALDATRHRRERFGQGTLGPEALWIDVRSYRLVGDEQRARTLAQELVHTWPSSPQARAAEQWLSGH